MSIAGRKPIVCALNCTRSVGSRAATASAASLAAVSRLNCAVGSVSPMTAPNASHEGSGNTTRAWRSMLPRSVLVPPVPSCEGPPANGASTPM